MKFCYARIVACSIPLVLTAAVRAGIMFDPDGSAAGNGPSLVQSFDFLPGNSLAMNALVSPGSYVQLYEARLGSLIAPDGSIIPVPGLNSTFEITAIAAYTASSSTSGNVTTSTLAAGPTYLKLYYDTAKNANDLSGVGFNDGTLIYSGSISSAMGVFLSQGANVTALLDQFNVDDWAGKMSAQGIGGLTLSADTISDDINFFLGGLGVTGVSANTSTALSYLEADPSHQFVGLDGTTAVLPNPGTINGVNGPDILIQADANAAFHAVPEPASLGLLGLGALSLLASRRR